MRAHHTHLDRRCEHGVPEGEVLVHRAVVPLDALHKRRNACVRMKHARNEIRENEGRGRIATGLVGSDRTMLMVTAREERGVAAGVQR